MAAKYIIYDTEMQEGFHRTCQKQCACKYL